MNFTTEALVAFARTIEHQKLLTSTGASFTVSVMNERLSFRLSDESGLTVRNLSKTSLDNVVHSFLDKRSFAPADYGEFSNKAEYTLPVIEAYLRNFERLHRAT